MNLSFFSATLVSKTLLNHNTSEQKTYHFEFKMPANHPPYHVGDRVALIPNNNPTLVNRFLAYSKKTGLETFYHSKDQTSYCLQEYLLQKVDLHRVSLALIRFLAKSSSYFSILLQDMTACQNFIQTHHIWHCLEYMEKAVNIEHILPYLLPQRPRLYSICSAPSVHPHEIHLLVSEQHFSMRNEIHPGIASYFLCHTLQTNTTHPIAIQSSPGFTIPDNHSAAMLMIGAGTGIAPYRAFLQERKQQKASGAHWLFLGARYAMYDFYYQEFFQQLEQENMLRIHTAFSRDQKHKIYIQDRLLEQGQEIFQWIQNQAYIFVCGSAQKMAPAVDVAIQQILMQYGNLSLIQAKQLLRDYKKQKKYLLDVY